MNRISMGLLALMALLLAGCGPPRFFTMEEMNEAELRNTPSFRAKDVEWQFNRPGNWEISDKDWREMQDVSNQRYLRILNDNKARPIYLGGQGGAMIEVTITHIDRGHYTFFTYSPAVIEAHLKITDASGKTLFKGTGKGRTREGGWKTAGDGGRLEGAHADVAFAIRDLINYYEGKK
jgi:hypothetical protein